MKINTDCHSEHDPNALTVDEALHQIKKQITPLSGFSCITLRDALGKTLAKNIISPINVPAFTNSAMDGYAIRYEDIQTTTAFTIAGVSYAGKPHEDLVTKGQCIRIMTGALMPKGADTVIMQEHIVKDGDVIRFESTLNLHHKQGQNIRHTGEDLAINQIALPTGHQLKAADIGLIASLGLSEITVYRNIRVAFFSTGDELKSLGEPLNSGEIYDSNRYTIYSMLKNLGVDILDMGIIKDCPESLRSAFEIASTQADVVITSGGVSVGDADYIKLILAELGSINFWKIAMKPGRPLAVGKLKESHFFGLPGNPVSAMVTFYQFVQPALRHLQGQKETENTTLQLSCISPLKKRPGRVDFQRGIIFQTENGEYKVKTTGNQGSHVLSSMTLANCFIILPEEVGNIEAGSQVKVQPFYGLC